MFDLAQFFHFPADKLESFLKHFPDFPTAFFVGGPADNFVIELTDQVRVWKSLQRFFHLMISSVLLLMEMPFNMFINFQIHQLQKLKVEPVLLHYLSQITVLQGKLYSVDDVYCGSSLSI